MNELDDPQPPAAHDLPALLSAAEAELLFATELRASCERAIRAATSIVELARLQDAWPQLASRQEAADARKTELLRLIAETN